MPHRRYRVVLILLVFIMTILKLRLAAHTFGTNDMIRWVSFAGGVAKGGPVGVYHWHFAAGLYNHPPLVGYLLLAVNALTRHGLSFPLAMRLPAIAAEAITPFLVLNLLETRRSSLESFAAAVSVSLSPVLFIIAGFHGNTDPVFIMFALLSVFLLVDRRAPELAGFSIAIALSVKIVPVVLVPTLLAFAILSGRRFALRFCLASGALFLLIWTPAALGAWQPLRDNVLGYAGGWRQWGLVQLGNWAGNPAWLAWFEGAGRFLAVLVAAFLPAALFLRRPQRVVEASALALTGLLILSPAFGTQYLAWAVAPAYLLSFWGGTAYNLIAGYLLIAVYTRWSGGFPWYWAVPTKLTPVEVIVALSAWAVLLTTYAIGVGRSIWSDEAGYRGPVRTPKVE